MPNPTEPSIHNEQTLQNVYNMEVATNLLRTYITTQTKTSPAGELLTPPGCAPNALAMITTIILTATALQNTLNNTSNWSNLP